MRLTQAGENFSRTASRVIGELFAAESALKASAGQQRLVVHSLPTFTMHWLMPKLAAFNERHPGSRLISPPASAPSIAIRRLIGDPARSRALLRAESDPFPAGRQPAGLQPELSARQTGHCAGHAWRAYRHPHPCPGRFVAQLAECLSDGAGRFAAAAYARSYLRRHSGGRRRPGAGRCALFVLRQTPVVRPAGVAFPGVDYPNRRLFSAAARPGR